MIDKSLIKKFIPFEKTLYHWYMHFKGRQKKVCLGEENQDKIFYVIGQDDLGGGLFWIINKVLMHIAYAIDHHYIPVVDFLNHKTQYTNERQLGDINFWELFFTQPAGYSLDDISHSQHVIINKQSPAPQKKYLMGQEAFYDNEDRISYFRSLFHQYIHFNGKTKDLLNSSYASYLEGKGKVVGVLCRGTDYVLLKPKGHPIQPAPEQVIRDVRTIMANHHCSHVFLATEDEDIFQLFIQAFGDKLLYLDQRRYRKADMDGRHVLSEEKFKDKSRNPYQDAVQYLTAIYLLSRCNCFLGGRTGGTKGVLLMSKGFEFEKTYNLGLYK